MNTPRSPSIDAVTRRVTRRPRAVSSRFAICG
jgi:hypothetical protein